jgi:ABC-type branched-subunit amino acid transport system substrate-binding protein
MQQTGTPEGSKIAEYISRNTFKGAFGDISFDKNGDVTKAPYVVWKVKDGKFVEVK